MKAFSRATKDRALQLLRSGMSTRLVSHRVGVSQQTVARWRALEAAGIPTPRGGRPRKLTIRDDTIIARHASTGRHSTATTIQQVLQRHSKVTVHRATVSRSLARSGLSACAKRKKPLLSTKHRKARLAFAKKYKDWTMDQWKRVFFSDESKINRYGSDGRQYCWKKRGEPLRDHHVVPTLKHGGGSIMVWACFCASGPGYICQIEGNMNAQDYCGILESDLRDSLEYYQDKISDPIFQHDNDPKHTARVTREWLDDSGLEILDWPSQSPDLNPIEHTWFIVKQKLKEYPTMAKNSGELWDRVVEIWNGLTTEECSSLVDSMPRRIAAVIAAKGGHTKY
jgi:transposase